MYDIIVVGGRVAGSASALLLARSGLRVLVLERNRFPKDTLNGHAILATGARSLRHWGLLERLLATGCQPFARHRYDFGAVQLAGDIRWPDGEAGVELAPRRYVLDTLLADAAAVAGAEIRQGFAVDDLIWEDDRVVGIRGKSETGALVTERATLVIGADGFHSMVAARVGAEAYETIPSATCIYYSHWSGVPTDSLEVVLRPGNYAVVFPSNDGLTCVAVGWPNAAFARVRSNAERELMRVVDTIPTLAERVRSGRREEPMRGTADLPMFLRTPTGPGWALVGDAGCRVDPITGQGLTDAFRDAELLTDAVFEGFSGAKDVDHTLAAFQRRRDAAVLPMYRYTAGRAELKPPGPELQRLVAGLASNQSDIDQFAGITAGTTSIADFFAPDNIDRIVGQCAAAA